MTALFRQRQWISAAIAAGLAAAPLAWAQGATDQPINPAEKLDAIQKQIGQDKRDVEVLSRSAVELEADQQRLRQQLVQAAANARAREGDLNAVEQRLAMLETREALAMRALAGERGRLASLLAVLQRMGSEPPPALIVRPDDATAAARSAMLLTAVVPAVQEKAQKLGQGLLELRHLRQRAAEERLKVAATAGALEKDRNVLAELLNQRRYLAVQTDQRLKSTQARIGTLAEQASDLRALIATLEEDAKRPGSSSSAPLITRQIVSGGVPRAVPLDELRGLLTLPANGELKSRFGASDGAGGHLSGVHLETRPLAQVTSPCDGKIMFAGSFRGYGRMLIIAANGGYHVLLAGLSTVDGVVGQVVLAGEPVGRMGASQQGSGGGKLYIEFRRNGVPVDPAPWFAVLREKVSG